MTQKSEPSIDAEPLPEKTLFRIFLARLALFWERLWPALWPALGVLGVFFIFTLSGIWRHMPLWSLGAVKVFFVTAFVFALWREVKKLEFPTIGQGIRRLETKSGLSHRPISSLLDELPPPSNPGAEDPASHRLWNIHKKRLFEKLAHLRVGLPQSALARRDPLALRALIGLGLFISFMSARPDVAGQFAWIQDPASGRASLQSVIVDAWINPPPYTGEPPIFLSRKDADIGGGANLEVPIGSVFTAHVQGAPSTPMIELNRENGATENFEPVGTGVFEYTASLTNNVTLTILSKGKEMGTWTIAVREDENPIIEFADEISATKQLSVKIPYGVMDDYGVVKAYASITLREAPQEGEQQDMQGAAPAEILIDLPLPSLRTKSAEDVAYQDLTAHEWAGLEVEIQLHAQDQADQKGTSKVVAFTLPERPFAHPLAKALIEQRKHLARRPDEAFRVARMLDALTAAPQNYYPDLSIYLGLRTAHWKLIEIVQRSKGPEAIDEVSRILWDIALSLEDGNVSLAARRLKELQQQLSDALADGKPQDEIDRIMEALRQALDDYLAALTAQGLEALRDNPQQGNPSGTPVTRQDWQELLDTIEQMLRDGNMEGARQMLSQMMNMLENLQLTFGGPGMSEGESAMNEALGNLGDMIGRQRGLLDETFRQAQPGAPDVSPTNPGAPSPGDKPGGALSENQEELRRELSEALQALRDQGIDVPGELDRAARAMGRARDELQGDNMEGALDPQKEAIDQLRQGAQDMAQDLLDRMASRQGLNGENGEEEGDFDPLGRPSASNGPEFGDSVKIPGERDRQRARDILQELRRRASEMGRPAFELEYLERLLKQF